MEERIAESGGNPWVQWRVEHEGKPLSWWMAKMFGEGPAGVCCGTCRFFSSRVRRGPGGFWTAFKCAASEGGGQWDRGWAACGNYQVREDPHPALSQGEREYPEIPQPGVGAVAGEGGEEHG